MRQDKVFAGAEKVEEEKHRAWMKKIDIRLMEGYGAAETAPILAVYTSMH